MSMPASPSPQPDWIQLASLGISVVALIQPWVIKFWETYVRRGRIDTHETGTIELGYSEFGPTIGLHGTLRAIHRDQFVRSIELTIVRKSDKSQHVFEWVVFRSEKMTLGKDDEQTVELPSGFLLTVAQPRRYNILFSDALIRSEMRSILERVKEAWSNALREAAEAIPPEVDRSGLSYQEFSEVVYDRFNSQPVHIQAFAALDRLCYWEPGTYSLVMKVNTARPNRSFPTRWEFEVSEPESQWLRNNAIKLVQGACGQQVYGGLNFVFTGYRSLK